jgi:hypothetical protein
MRCRARILGSPGQAVSLLSRRKFDSTLKIARLFADNAM